MPRAHYVDTLLGTSGTGMVSVLGGATIHVYDQGTTNLLSQTLYTSDAGSGTLTNPFTSEADGTVELWLATAARVDLVATKTGYTTIRRTVDVEDVPGSGGGGSDGSGALTRVYQHVCTGSELSLSLPAPAATVSQRLFLAQITVPGDATAPYVFEFGGGNPNDPASPAARTLSLLVAGRTCRQEATFLFPNGAPLSGSYLGTDSVGGLDSGSNAWAAGIPDWTLILAGGDGFTAMVFPAGTTVEVWDQDAG